MVAGDAGLRGFGRQTPVFGHDAVIVYVVSIKIDPTQ
jgi:hypothetical protein